MMATVPARPTAVSPVLSLRTPPLTMEDRLLHIQSLGQRVAGHVEFMCASGSLQGTSPEAREKAVTAFYERLVALERVLDRIHEDLQLG